MKMLTCNTCERTLEATRENFHVRKDTKRGFSYKCKKCTNEYAKVYRENNKEKIIVRNRKYYQENKEALRNQAREYYYENKDEINERYKEYYQENRQRIRKQQSEYRLNNLDKERKRNRRWKEENYERKQEYYKEWARRNPDKVRIKSQKRRARKKRLPNTLTLEQWQDIMEHFNNKCAYCGKEKKLEQEHFIPVSEDGEYTHNNIIPACKSCNLSKLDKNFFDWYPSYKHYSKRREQKILRFLGYTKDKKQQLSLI